MFIFLSSDDTERRARMQKVAANRQRKRTQGPSESDQINIKEEPLYVKEEPLSDTDQQPDQSGLFYGSESFLSSLSEALTQTPNWKESYLLETPQMLGATCIMSPEKDPNQYRTLVPAEIVLFEELKKSYSNTLGEMIPNLTENSYSSANDLVNQSEVAVRRLIKFIKRMQDFQQISQEDQIALLKASVLNSLLLRSAFFYSIEDDAWVTPTGTIPTTILKSSTGFGEIHDLHTEYCRTLKEITTNDYGLFALLQIIVVFDPDGDEVRNKEFISNIQDKYLVLLKHYLEAEFSFTKGQEFFATLMQKIVDMKQLNDCHTKILLQVNPCDIEPLMLEVLNLK